jgi:hypothetical protein
MSPATHQTLKLSRGRHSSPRDGACVMELASMLAGERFTDHPRSVCPVLGSLLRSYNDATDDERRQDLYPVAAAVVDTAGGSEVRRQRAEHLTEWIARRHEVRKPRALLPGPLRRVSRRKLLSTRSLGSAAVATISRHTDETHREFVALVRELIEIGRPSDPARIASALDVARHLEPTAADAATRADDAAARGDELSGLAR